MAKVYVVWQSYREPDVIRRGYWDQGLLEDTFERSTLDFEHVGSVDDIPQGEGPDQQGAVFVINGRTHTEDTDKINADIAKLRWVLFVETGDEEALFPWREVKHPLMRVWLQLPRMNQHDDTHFKLPNGYRPDTRYILRKIGKHERRLDWFFAGQINHERREQCVQELEYLINSGEAPNGLLVKTERFGEEKMEYSSYLQSLAASKIALCPSGIESPDNFRLYEALEAGCLPVVDAFSSRHKAPGFWRYLLGDDIPFPVVDYWDALPKLMPTLLRGWPENANRAYAWWQARKRQIQYQLEDDIRELSK